MMLKVLLNLLSSFLFLFFFVHSVSADSFTLSGSVKDSLGNAISSATISVNDVNNDSTATDISGNYSFLVPSGTYNIQVTPPSGSGFNSAIAFSQNISSNTVINFVLTPVGIVTLSGYVYNASGTPLPNQTVSVGSAPNSPGVAYAITDVNGFYSFQVAPGVYPVLNLYSSGNSPSLNVPPAYSVYITNYSLTQNTTLNFTLPAKKVKVHVQDAFNNPVSDVAVSASSSNGGGTYGGFVNSSGSLGLGNGFSGHARNFNNATTDQFGDATMWLLPNDTYPPDLYKFIATPPSGSTYSQFTLNNITVVGDQTELISLQFIHDQPVTTAIFSPDPSTNGEYDDPTTITLSAAAAPGYAIANTYYKIDEGAQQTYVSPFTVSGEGQHTIIYWSVDNVGVPEAPKNKSFTIHVNEAPVINPIEDATLNEGSAYSTNGLFTDSDSTVWTGKVDYGDGSGEQSLPLAGNTFNLNHIYKDNGLYTIIVKITDDEGAFDTEEAAITINNASPEVGSISVSSNPVIINTSITAEGSFIDPGILDTHIATWNWGDGTTSIGTVTESSGSGTVSDSHTYTAPGVYEIVLTVKDNNNYSSASTYQYLSVYNPTNQGLFTGVRIFQSPFGSYYPNPTLSGLVRFGVSAKYTGSAPTGDVSMNFSAANFEFQSDSIQSLVTFNGRAMLAGTGIVNGLSGYTFMVSGIDGTAGGQGLIRFQIKNGSTIVYDSQLGAPIISDPTIPVTGQVIVH